jgi:biotin synthase
VLSGHALTADAGLSILARPDLELPALLAATYRVRHGYWGNEVQLYSLRNAKSGLCPEDCGYCSQSKISSADIPKYRFNDEATLLESARLAAESKSRTFCIVAAGRGPSDRELEHVVAVVRKIKSTLPLNICCCLGLLTPDQARQLADAGVDRVNHNLNTSRRFYPEICSTHTFDDRLETLQAVRDAGMELCSGGIVGMGETHLDVVDLALTLRNLKVESIPVNFLHPIDGTPLAGRRDLSPRDCLKMLCLFRLNAGRLLRVVRREFTQPHYVMVVGLGDAALRLGRQLEDAGTTHGIRLSGFFADSPGGQSSSEIALDKKYPVHAIDQLPEMLRSHVIDEIIFATDSRRNAT